VIRSFTILLAATLALAGCGPAPSEPAADSTREAGMDIEPGLREPVRTAIDNLAERIGVTADAIEVAEAAYVTWPNGALGCPEPGMAYTQALVSGYRIRLAHDGAIHHYHGAEGRPPFHCPAERVSSPAAESPGRINPRA
jgi:hypothetical protein